MRLSDGLKQRRGDIVERLEKLSQTAEREDRLFTADEAAAWDAAQAEVRDLDKQVERQVAAENMRRTQPGRRIAVDDHGKQHPILRSTDKLSDRHPPRDGQPLDIAKALRGITTGRWEDADYERRAMSEASLPGGGYAVPAELSSLWIDLARAKAVTVAAGAETVVMTSQTLRIASIVGDVVPNFRPEHVALPENDVVFGALDFRARLIGVICRASLELISDAPNASEMITASMTGALGVAMDGAMLSGSGLVDATHDTPRGILLNPNINTIATVGTPTNYDPWLTGINLIERANLEPTAVVDHPDTVGLLRRLKTGLSGDQSTLLPPPAYSALTPFVTTGLAAGTSIVGDFTHALFGMREGVVIEATRTGADALSKAEILIRAFMRFDVGLTQPKAFAALTGITLATAGAAGRRAA